MLTTRSKLLEYNTGILQFSIEFGFMFIKVMFTFKLLNQNLIKGRIDE